MVIFKVPSKPVSPLTIMFLALTYFFSHLKKFCIEQQRKLYFFHHHLKMLELYLPKEKLNSCVIVKTHDKTPV